jgi:ABC-type multidrug transport system ATPase subunit
MVGTEPITLEAQGVKVIGRGGRVLVDGVDLEFGDRSLIAVVGPSGSGKSSLLTAISGIRPAAVGDVFYCGQSLYANYDELRESIGFVPQADLIHNELAVREALDYAARLRFAAAVTAEERSSRIDEVLRELELSHRSASQIASLSGGERKRASVALELLTKPTLLFLDEPCSGLDPGLTRVLMRLLRALADGGRTVVVVTHEFENLGLCDKVLVLAPGGVPVYFGEPAGAPTHFGHADLTDVFCQFATEDDEAAWPVDRVGAAPAAHDPAIEPSSPAPPAPRRQPWFGQLRTLCSRYVAVLMADRRNALLLALQAPVLGVLMLAALPPGEFQAAAGSQVRLVSTAGLVLFVLFLAITWIGSNNAVREIARELPILRRERAVGLSLSAYVASKFLVLGALTTVQAVVLVAIATARQHGPEAGALFGWGRGELTIAVIMAGLAAMAIGLAISALVQSPEQATSVLPMFLILQLVLSAGVVLPAIGDKPVLRQLAQLSSAQWGVAAGASTVDLNRLQLFDSRIRDLRVVDSRNPAGAINKLTRDDPANAHWSHTAEAWLIAMAALVALTLGALGIALLRLRRLDPVR